MKIIIQIANLLFVYVPMLIPVMDIMIGLTWKIIVMMG